MRLHCRSIRHPEKIYGRENALIYSSGEVWMNRGDAGGMTPDFAVCFDGHPLSICAVLMRAGDQFQLSYEHASRGIVREQVLCGMDISLAQRMAIARMKHLIATELR